MKCLPYIEEARCLKVKSSLFLYCKKIRHVLVRTIYKPVSSVLRGKVLKTVVVREREKLEEDNASCIMKRCKKSERYEVLL